MDAKVLPIFAVVFIIILISGCTSQQPTGYTTKQDATSSLYFPTNINAFMGVKEGEIMRFFFVLEDRNGANTPGDGHVTLTIMDGTENSIYEDEFDVTAQQFVDYQYKLTGSGIGKAYEWRIPFNSIAKGKTERGTAKITFTTTQGKSFSDEYTFLEIPSYMPEEVKQHYEEAYLKTAKPIGEIKTLSNFEVKIVRVGYFKHLQYDTVGDEVTDFRVDIQVKNIGSIEDTFSIYSAKLISGSSQYKYSYNSKFDGADIAPSILKEGYILFSDVPKDLTGEVKINAGEAGSYPYSYTYQFLLNI